MRYSPDLDAQGSRPLKRLRKSFSIELELDHERRLSGEPLPYVGSPAWVVGGMATICAGVPEAARPLPAHPANQDLFPIWVVIGMAAICDNAPEADGLLPARSGNRKSFPTWVEERTRFRGMGGGFIVGGLT